MAADGTAVCRDERTLRFFNPENRPERILDFEVTLFASNGPLTLGDTKEGTMAVRLAETMRLQSPVGHGHIVNSAGVQDDETWGKRADWCDYYGPVAGKPSVSQSSTTRTIPGTPPGGTFGIMDCSPPTLSASMTSSRFAIISTPGT